METEKNQGLFQLRAVAKIKWNSFGRLKLFFVSQRLTVKVGTCEAPFVEDGRAR